MYVAKYSVSEPFEYWSLTKLYLLTKPYLQGRFLFHTEHSPYLL
jgi:hypothetical protein